MPRTPKSVAHKPLVLIFAIEYRVQPENVNIEEVLDKMREMGAALVVNVRVEEGEP